MNVFQIQLPKADNDGNRVDIESVVDDIINVAGGATVTEGTGFWKDETGNLFVDPVITVQTYTDDVLLLSLLVDTWRVRLKQYALVYSTWAVDAVFVEGSI